MIGALVAAFAVMMCFEFVNSLFFPFPAGMDVNNLEAVRAFSISLPWNAYILIWFGWVLGSSLAGWLVVRISGEKTDKLPVIVGLILTALGIANFLMLTHPIWFVIIGLPMFLMMSMAGGRVAAVK